MKKIWPKMKRKKVERDTFSIYPCTDYQCYIVQKFSDGDEATVAVVTGRTEMECRKRANAIVALGEGKR